jgi:hypothetical protein
MSDSTINRLAHDNGLLHWRAKTRPELSDKNAAESYSGAVVGLIGL